jgi:hypothetical protein
MLYNFYTPEAFKEYFTPDFYIDTLQTTKKNITNKIITDKTLNKAANDYIDAQTAFAKMLSKNATDIAKYSVDSLGDKFFPQVKTKEAKS